MQDRFRFRVWWKPDYEKPKMLYNAEQTYDFLKGAPEIIPADSFGEVLEDKDFIVMQCTGLKDKNGKLIYEGDIVKANYITPIGENKEKICTIKFNRCAFWIHYDSFASYLANEECAYEIIGNIYENKDLLNE